ncbi:MAG: hypothetical protein IJC70_04660, partial [Firmicutes bacterium]|nr:hypothetical protein [Bacillota bacterium]
MLCEICQVNEATVRMVAIENGNKEEHYYCKACLEANPHLNKMIGAFPGLGSLGAAAPRGGMGRISSRLTQNAVQALQWAERYAKEHHSAYVHTEHILLALFEREGLAARVLEELKLHKEVLAEAIDHEENLGARFAGLSPHSKRALQLAVEEAVRMGLTFVDTEHILLGLAAEGEGHAAAWLRDMADADAARIRSIIYELIEQYRGASAAAKPEEGAAAKKATSTPTTDKFSRDLTQLAREEQLDPVIGREKEIERVIQILSRRTKNNPVLIGE